MKPMKTEMGTNRTGISVSPTDAKETVQGATLGPISPGPPEGIAEVRKAYIEEADPVGSVALPTTVSLAVEAVVDAIRGKEPTQLLDKLGERLAFERTGTRLYDAILVKLDAEGSWEGGPTYADVARIRDDELAHFRLLFQALEEMGADPTAVTPGADVVGVASMGLLQVVADPRTTLSQSLEAILTAELTDNDGWGMLVALARRAGKDELVRTFMVAEQHEAEHLAAVRAWLRCHAGIGAVDTDQAA